MGTADQTSHQERKPEVLQFLDYCLMACVGVITACLVGMVVILVFALEPADVARIEAAAQRMAK